MMVFHPLVSKLWAETDQNGTFFDNNCAAVGRWFPPGAPVSSIKKLISSSFHLDMTLAVAEALNPNKPILNVPFRPKWLLNWS